MRYNYQCLGKQQKIFPQVLQCSAIFIERLPELDPRYSTLMEVKV
jgi:hypothetical protein